MWSIDKRRQGTYVARGRCVPRRLKIKLARTVHQRYPGSDQFMCALQQNQRKFAKWRPGLCPGETPNETFFVLLINNRKFSCMTHRWGDIQTAGRHAMQ